MAKLRERCGLKKCGKALGPGAAEVGFTTDKGVEKVRVCSEHAWIIMTAPRGTWRITEEKDLVAIPAKQFFI